MVTVWKRFGLDSTFCDWCFSSHEIVKAARKKASKVCWQCLAETFRETLVKKFAANVMQEVGNRCLLVCTCGGRLSWGLMDVKMPLLLRDTENNGSFAEFGKSVLS